MEREERKERGKIKPVWADMMKHSLLCGKEAKVIYTSILHAEIKENETEMQGNCMESSMKNSTAKDILIETLKGNSNGLIMN